MSTATMTAIVRYLRAHPWTTTKRLAARIHRSEGTVRKYLRQLNDEAALQKRSLWVSQYGYTWEYALVKEEE